MQSIYITVVGFNHYMGMDFIKKGMKLMLKKDKDNECDKEAIEVKLPALGRIGYVANSPYTVVGECQSAGRIYDKIRKTAIARVVYKLESKGAVVCELLGS